MRTVKHKIQSLNAELKQKELDLKAIKILYRHSPFYIIGWMVVTILSLFFIMTAVIFISLFTDSILNNQLFYYTYMTLISVILPIFLFISPICYDYVGSKYFNLNKLNKAINKIKNMNNEAIFLIEQENNINILKEMMKKDQDEPLTYGNVAKKFREVRIDLYKLKKDLDKEKMFYLQKRQINE